MHICDAGPEHIEGIAAIYNDAVRNTTAIWNDVTVDLANRTAWLADRQKLGYPVLVALKENGGDGVSGESGGVLGYASFGDWRAFDGYRYTVEHSVYVRGDQRGQGIGHALMAALIEKAQALGKHVMVAAIEANNTGSIRLHEKLGFEHTGHMKEVGTKFGTWLDLAFMQRKLDTRARPD